MRRHDCLPPAEPRNDILGMVHDLVLSVVADPQCTFTGDGEPGEENVAAVRKRLGARIAVRSPDIFISHRFLADGDIDIEA